jgi:hypothetical protein
VTYPGYYSPCTTLGYIYRTMLGNPEKALEEAREAMRLEPNHSFIHTRMHNTRDLTDEQWQTLDPLIPRPRNDVMAGSDLGIAAGPSFTAFCGSNGLAHLRPPPPSDTPGSGPVRGR